MMIGQKPGHESVTLMGDQVGSSVVHTLKQGQSWSELQYGLITQIGKP